MLAEAYRNKGVINDSVQSRALHPRFLDRRSCFSDARKAISLLAASGSFAPFTTAAANTWSKWILGGSYRPIQRLERAGFHLTTELPSSLLPSLHWPLPARRRCRAVRKYLFLQVDSGSALNADGFRMKRLDMSRPSPPTPMFAITMVPACPPRAPAQVRVLMSGGFRAPYEELLPQFEKTTGITVTTATGASQGDVSETHQSHSDRKRIRADLGAVQLLLTSTRSRSGCPGSGTRIVSSSRRPSPGRGHLR